MDVSQAPGENISWNFQFTPSLVPKGPPIRQVIAELADAKKTANKRYEYIKGLVAYLNQFARGREHLSISDFNSGTIERWFASRNEASTTRASNIGRLSSLFSYAVRRKYISENPCDALESITIDRAEPEILTPEQIKSAMDFSLTQPPRFLLWFVLAGIVGIRPGELRKMTEQAVNRNLSEGLIIINAMISKVRNRRVIQLTEHAQTWLEFAVSEKIKLPFSKSFMKRSRHKLKSHLQLAHWRQDILRHTALSYLVAFHGDEERVAREAGNSVRILREHYLGMVRPVDSDFIQSILPSSIDEVQLELKLIATPLLPPDYKPVRNRYSDLDHLPPRQRAVARVQRWRERERYALGLSQRGKPRPTPIIKIFHASAVAQGQSVRTGSIPTPEEKTRRETKVSVRLLEARAAVAPR